MLKRLPSGWSDGGWRGLRDKIARLRKLPCPGDAAEGQGRAGNLLFQAAVRLPGALLLWLKTTLQGNGGTLPGGMAAPGPEAVRHPAGIPAEESRRETGAKTEIAFLAKPGSYTIRSSGQENISVLFRAIQEQLIRGRRGDAEIFDEISEIYKGVKKGRILLQTQLPAADGLDRDVIRPAAAAGRQEAAGHGETVRAGSWLAAAGRRLIAPADGRSALESASGFGSGAADAPPDTGPEAAAFRVAFCGSPAGARQFALPEAGGLRALHEALSAGAPGAELAQDCIAKAARTGASLAQAALRRSGRTGAPATAARLDAMPGGSPSLVSAGVNRAINLPPRSGRMHRNVLADRKEAYRLRQAAVPPERLAKAISPEALEHARAVAARHGVILDLLPPARSARELIESGAAVPVPPFIHNRALAEPEYLLGARGKPGSIGHYLPVLPAKNAMPEEEYAGLVRIAGLRLQEYFEEFVHIRRLESSQCIFVRNGVIHDVKTGKVFAGGAELFEIRDGSTGDPLPLCQENPDGSPAYDMKTGLPVCHPLREEVIRELRAGPFRARRGVVRDGMRPLAEPASDGPAADADLDAPRVPEDGLLLAVWPDGRLEAVSLVQTGGSDR